jgi:cytochrome b subunit of formate dehydrogenase
VSRNWAKKHHSVWYKEYVKEEEEGKKPEA